MQVSNSKIAKSATYSIAWQYRKVEITRGMNSNPKRELFLHRTRGGFFAGRIVVVLRHSYCTGMIGHDAGINGQARPEYPKFHRRLRKCMTLVVREVEDIRIIHFGE